MIFRKGKGFESDNIRAEDDLERMEKIPQTIQTLE